MGYAGVEKLFDRHGTKGVFAISSLDSYEPHIPVILGSRLKDFSSSGTLASTLRTGHKPPAARSTLSPIRGGRIAAAVVWNMSVLLDFSIQNPKDIHPFLLSFMAWEPFTDDCC